MSSTSKPIKYLILSDIHLGNQRNKTAEILNNLCGYFNNFSNNSIFINIDIIFIAGDLFDTLLDLSGNDIHEIQICLSRLMDFCARHNIKLRILEGTPSHDWKQAKLAETVATLIDIPLDFRYVENLSIENFSDLGINVLYVPDEWTHCTDETLKQVKHLLVEKDLVEVDIAIMHGSFKYQMKDIPGKHQVHDEIEYLNLVKHYISIGHIHSFSAYERIIAQGSFDRLSHNEEEAKGGVLCTIDKVNGNSFDFIENKGAKGFCTVKLKHRDIDKCYKQIDKVVSKLKVDDYVRIKAPKDHPLYVAFDDLKVQYPMFNFTKTVLEDETKEKENTKLLADVEYTPLTITKENVISLLMAEISVKHQLAPTNNALLLDLLEGAL